MTPIASCRGGPANSSTCCDGLPRAPATRAKRSCDNRVIVEQPDLETSRLRLRPFEPSDAERLQSLAGSRAVAEGTLLIPHPYPPGEAATWIAARQEARAAGNIVYAITLRVSGELVGAIGLALSLQHDKGELGYWIGEPYWGRGLATEAAAAVIGYGFESLGLNRLSAIHFTRNPASGRVLEKNGMRHEGSLRQDLKKWDQYVDVEVYGILRSDWRQRSRL
jgi:ribosomal-protein-alanine N-acetyltransferase